MVDLIVLDTNVFINAIFDRKNFPNDMRLLRLESQGLVKLAFSQYTLDELFKIMSRHINDENIFECSDFFRMLSRVADRSTFLQFPSPTEIITNKSDQNFVDLAVDVSANYLITNDIDSGILQKKELNGVKFKTPFQYIHEFYKSKQASNNS